MQETLNKHMKRKIFLIIIPLILLSILIMLFVSADTYNPSAQLTTSSSGTSWKALKCTSFECTNLTVSITSNSTNYVYVVQPKNQAYWTSSDWATIGSQIKLS